MEQKQKQDDIKKVLLDSIYALSGKRKALIARKHILSMSNPEEFIPKKSLFGPATSPLEQNISFAAVKRDLLIADVRVEISQLDDQLLARKEHLKQVEQKIEELENDENKDE